ncbi:hypothetical protein Aperf_G00000130437 [Anoplocephala perfoliata]
MSDEVLGNVSKNEYDEATKKSLASADLTYKICKEMKAWVESTITPNPIRKFTKVFTSEFNLTTPGDQPKSEKLGNTLNECMEELLGTDLSVTLSQFTRAFLDLGKSEHELILDIKSGLLSEIDDFLTKYWPDLQKERRNLDLKRLDYDWARNEKRNKDAAKVVKAKEEFERQLYVTQVLLTQCETTRAKLANAISKFAEAQYVHYKRCGEIMQRLNADISPTDNVDAEEAEH